MIKKPQFPPNLPDKKLKASRRFLLILSQLQHSFTFRKLCSSFSRLTFYRKKDLSKFTVIQSVKKRFTQQAFLTLKSFHKPTPQKDKSILYLRKLFFASVVRIFHQKQRKNYNFAFQKIKSLRKSHNSDKIASFSSIITSFSNSFQKRVFLAQGLTRMKKIRFNHSKLKTFFTKLNSWIQHIKNVELQQSFNIILKEGFVKMYLSDVKRKHENIMTAKNENLGKQEQLRLLKTQISALKKTLQFQETAKTKNRKEDYDRNLILQAKSTQKQKTNQEFKKVSFENENLSYQMSKKQAYLKLKQEFEKDSKNAENVLKKIYEFFRSEKTRETMNLKELSVLMSRQGIDMNLSLKKFGLSKEQVMNENIDLKNLQNLYERELPGYGVGVNIKESETYRKTMEENVNLRELLQILVVKHIEGEEKELGANKDELSRIVQAYQIQQKSSKLSVTTLSSSSTNGFSR